MQSIFGRSEPVVEHDLKPDNQEEPVVVEKPVFDINGYEIKCLKKINLHIINELDKLVKTFHLFALVSYFMITMITISSIVNNDLPGILFITAIVFLSMNIPTSILLEGKFHLNNNKELCSEIDNYTRLYGGDNNTVEIVNAQICHIVKNFLTGLGMSINKVSVETEYQKEGERKGVGKGEKEN